MTTPTFSNSNVHRQARPVGQNYEVLVRQKEKLADMLRKLQHPNPLLITRVENAEDDLDFTLVSASVFDELSMRYGELVARILVDNATDPLRLRGRSIGVRL